MKKHVVFGVFTELTYWHIGTATIVFQFISFIKSIIPNDT